MHTQATGVPFHRDRPRPAAHRAVLDQHARGIRVDVEIDPLSAVRAANADRVLHAGIVARADRDVTVAGAGLVTLIAKNFARPVPPATADPSGSAPPIAASRTFSAALPNSAAWVP